MIKTERLEWALLRAVSNASADDWIQLSLGELRNRLKDVDADAATEKINSIADAFISLAGEQALLMRKYEGGGRPLSFDFQRRNDEGYTSNFFSRDHFDVKLTHEGRRRISGSAGAVIVGTEPSRDVKAYDERLLYWLDLGNNASSGQFVLGQPKNSANRKKKDRLPTVAELYPEILNRDKKEDAQPSCSAAEALTRQEPFINQNLAYQALAMLTQLLRHGSVSYQGGFCNLATGRLVPMTTRAVIATIKRRRRGDFHCRSSKRRAGCTLG